ncbi:CRISPR-associated helicase Cas3' [Spirulina subsalsa]|uniref:type I-G CRISPR-associated helicase/endonuclease Cas3g n=1 Tax=Spirulina subsalsa TaxID=54311 RepID=UPI0002DF894A|nr:CRISPR-associated helicase Cas3' [Spirulina subsalsa]
MSNNFSHWFRDITSFEPFPYQIALAERPKLPQFLDAPTGAGKTAAIALAWLWRRKQRPRETPRRLVYCLPMRSLVEQTTRNIQQWLTESQESNTVQLHQFMGGSIDRTWVIQPEQSCILVGTQDQLLSRALNRGYSMGRNSWPIDFALVNNDCLWVMDETQLMGNGLRTTAQLQAFREQWGVYGIAQSLWMSATLHPEQVQTVDYQPDVTDVLQLSDADLTHPRLKPRYYAHKPLQRCSVVWDGGKETDYGKALVPEILAAHPPGDLTLVICNQVKRAQAIYQRLTAEAPHIEALLIHSRFRAKERTQQQERLPDFKGIVVATQAIEAGVDLSAAVLFTELAPWSSLVQRFGRCNRRGEQNAKAQIYWLDYKDLSKTNITLPYTVEALTTARSQLLKLSDVSPANLVSLNIPPEAPEGLIPRQSDLRQLFDTSTDLMGHDVDVSPFIRDQGGADVMFAWRDFEDVEDQRSLEPQELCRVSLSQSREFWKQIQKTKSKGYVWDRSQGKWEELGVLYPGCSILLSCRAGGYSDRLGFTGDPKDRDISEIARKTPKPKDKVTQESLALEQDDDDPTTYGSGFISLEQHADDVARAVAALCEALQGDYGWGDDLVQLLIRSGRYHDVGKAHEVFQSLLTRDRPGREGTLWAKSDHHWQDRNRPKNWRRGFRHEWASALGALAAGEEFLLVYLVACHHGKVRLTVQPRPSETAPPPPQRYACGVWEGDTLPKVELGGNLTLAETVLSLDCLEFGSQSWTNQAIALLDQYGPFQLAYLEALIRIADWQASARGNGG